MIVAMNVAHAHGIYTHVTLSTVAMGFMATYTTVNREIFVLKMFMR